MTDPKDYCSLCDVSYMVAISTSESDRERPPTPEEFIVLTVTFPPSPRGPNIMEMTFPAAAFWGKMSTCRDAHRDMKIAAGITVEVEV